MSAGSSMWRCVRIAGRSGVISHAARVFHGLAIPLRESFPCRDGESDRQVVCGWRLVHAGSGSSRRSGLEVPQSRSVTAVERPPLRAPAGHLFPTNPARLLLVSTLSRVPDDVRGDRYAAPFARSSIARMDAMTKVQLRSNHHIDHCPKASMNDGLAPFVLGRR
jgi:hypothetical protein